MKTVLRAAPLLAVYLVACASDKGESSLESASAIGTLASTPTAANTVGLVARPAPPQAVVWKDVNGAPVPIVSMDWQFGSPQQTMMRILDAHNQIVNYDYQNDVVSAVGTLDMTYYFTTSDCTGPVYVLPIPSRTTVARTTLEDASSQTEIRVVPDAAVASTITAVSEQGIKPWRCFV